ncbi:MAG: IS1595 family transposase [Rhodospirillales bacterium]
MKRTTKPKPPTAKQFLVQFPTDDACLDHLMRVRFGQRLVCDRCKREATYYRVRLRRCYECEFCGFQVYPTAGTPFEKTRTGLRDWYHVMFMFCTSRNGVSSKEVQRTIGVTYKTAWRMTKEIRTYMGIVDGDRPVGGWGQSRGVVEVDKAFIGGKRTLAEPDNKSVVLGMIERGGDIVTRVVPHRGSSAVVPQIVKWVRPGSKIASDEANAFSNLRRWGFRHETVNHAQREYVRGNVHTNTIENFWSLFKRGVKGTYVSVSEKHLQKYLSEFEYRHNHRKVPHRMFEILVTAFAWACPVPSQRAAG